MNLRRAAELVEAAAFNMAGAAPSTRIARLIEIAAELDRLSRQAANDSTP